MQLVNSAYAIIQQQLVDLITNAYGPAVGQIFQDNAQNAFDLMFHTLESVQNNPPSDFAPLNTQNIYFTGPDAGSDPAGPPPPPYNGDDGELKAKL